MGRHPRIDWPGAWHHVMNRGSGRRTVFHDDRDRVAFIDLLTEVDDRFGVEVHAFCLMGNHFHLVVRSSRGELPPAMQWASGIFTRATNRRRGVDGSVFRGRYHSVSVQDDAHFAVLARYVHRNPLALIGSAPLSSYRWSSYRAYLGVDRASDWLHTDVLLAELHGDARSIREHVEAATPCRRERSAGPDGVDQPPPDRIAFERVELMLFRANGIDGRVHRDALVRNAAIALSIDTIGVDRAAIERQLSMSGTALRTALYRGRKILADPNCATWVAAALEMIDTNVTLGV